MKTTLTEPRAAIDDIDRRIVGLLAERLDAVREICASKGESSHLPLRDEARERQVFEAWGRTARRRGLSSYHTGRILREILSYSRRVQENLLAGNEAAAGATGAVLTVGFQGVPSSYSDLTIGKVFALRTERPLRRSGFRTFTAVVEALEAGDIDYGLLPIENTIAGSINEVYDLLTRHAVTIVDEEEWVVDHCLVGLPEASMGDVRTIRSHPVALQQCQTFLGGLGDCSSEGFFDTAAAAESVVAEANRHVAAICSEECAVRLGLAVLARDIADHADNRTRFVLLSREPEAIDPRQAAKTSLVFTVDHRQGALAECLQEFAQRNINLSKIESRPRPASPSEYLFYVDIDGHRDHGVVAEVLAVVRQRTGTFKVLGSYPCRTGVRAANVIPPAPAVETPEGAAPTRASAHQRSELGGDGSRSIVHIGDVPIGGERFVVIAGPCAVETREQMMASAAMVKEVGAAVLRGGAFQPRTSPYSFQGLGFPGLDLLAEAGGAYELPIVTEVVHPDDAGRIAGVAHALQVGARNMQNFALLKELGRLQTPVLLKRGMSATIEDLLHAAEHITSGGNQRVILCERGIRTFETATRCTLDVSAVPVLKAKTHLPVIVDPSHAAGERRLVLPLALAATAAGADGLIVEAHPDPEQALCDRDQALTRDDLATLFERLEPIVRSLGRHL